MQIIKEHLCFTTDGKDVLLLLKPRKDFPFYLSLSFLILDAACTILTIVTFGAS